MIRPWLIWTVFGVSLSVLLGAMGWISLAVVELDTAQERSHLEADLEENVRLALWRLDSAMTPVIGQESMRPHFLYRPFYPTDQMVACTTETTPTKGDMIPSPLLLDLPPHIVLHFQYDEEGKISSPQVPQGGDLRVAQDGCATPERLASWSSRLKELQSLVPWESLLAAMGHEKPRLDPVRVGANRSPAHQLVRQDSAAQTLRNALEYSARSSQQRAAVQNYAAANSGLTTPVDPGEAIMRSYWVGQTLVLARKVRFQGEELIQGCWVDWPGLKRSLLSGIEDLLPGADLRPRANETSEKSARLLSALPAELIPGTVELDPGSLSSPIRISLVAAWACVILAAIAVAALLVGVLALSERRAAFVSAVTHELRTPLTTFRMYSEMLSRDMLQDPEKRRRYLTTLCTEADRLNHLVENVLSFARLERTGRDGRQLGSTTVEELLARVGDRLRDRAELAGMAFSVERSEDPVAPEVAVSVAADPGAVEQILFNLVDNACKYAREAEDQRLHLKIGAQAGKVTFRVEDHGPGISPDVARRLFRPFSKSASDAANSAPGVGLGLALCRRLARRMGGDLVQDKNHSPGAAFELRLPRG